MSKFEIHLLGKQQSCTGNLTTLNRLKYILSYYYNYKICIYNPKKDSAEQEEEEKNKITTNILYIGLHALHAGKILKDKKIKKYIIVLGGTDVNCTSINDNDSNIIKNCLKNSLLIIAFHQKLAIKALQLINNPNHPYTIIPQSVSIDLNPIIKNNDNSILKELGILNNNPNSNLILVILSSIRVVKDPFYLVDQFESWYKENMIYNKIKKIHLIIAGKILDDKTSYLSQYISKLPKNTNDHNYNGIMYIGSLNQYKVKELLLSSHILINTSISEGMSSAILEAMSLKKLILARNNDGNKSLIKHQYNGLLYNTPLECINNIDAIYKNGLTKTYQLLINNSYQLIKKIYA